MNADELREASYELVTRWMNTGDRPHVAEVTPLVVAYYALDGNDTGGSLHIVLEDENVNRGSVDWCLGWADAHGDKAGSALANVLRICSKRQRLAIANADDGRYGVTPA